MKLKTILIAAIIAVLFIVPGCGGGGGGITHKGGPKSKVAGLYADQWFEVELESISNPGNEELNFISGFRVEKWVINPTQLNFGISDTYLYSKADGTEKGDAFHGKFHYSYDNVSETYFFQLTTSLNGVEMPGHHIHGLTGISLTTLTHDGWPYNPESWPVIIERAPVDLYYPNGIKQRAHYKLTLRKIPPPS